MFVWDASVLVFTDKCCMILAMSCRRSFTCADYDLRVLYNYFVTELWQVVCVRLPCLPLHDNLWSGKDSASCCCCCCWPGELHIKCQDEGCHCSQLACHIDVLSGSTD